MGVDSTPAWQALKNACTEKGCNLKLEDLFSADEQRATRYAIGIDGLFLDYSKNRLTDELMALLLELAEQQQLAQWIERLLSGFEVNNTEHRPALHTALRAQPEHRRPEVEASLDKMALMVDKIRNKQWRGFSGKPITDVVNIGVGGSDLGPLMICHALGNPRSDIKTHFVSSIDGTQLSCLLSSLNPETTLFVVASKSFTTIDTMTNAETAKRWMVQAAANAELVMQHQFIGVSADSSKMASWGIPQECQLEFWDWVGGRYSLWSTIGFTSAIALGMESFRELLAGAQLMDEHFASAPLAENAPVLMGLIDIWNINFLGISAKSILPYDARLKHLPGYLEQLVMESNGK
ncbi:MAG: glucose-6-phosphate isomerase, partial [bacterium]